MLSAIQSVWASLRTPAANGLGAGAAGRDDAAPAQRNEPLTKKMRRRMAQVGPSFTALLPWADMAPETCMYEHIDGNTVGGMFEITPIATEGASEKYLWEIQHRVQLSLQSLEELDNPWILQFFVNDDQHMTPLKRRLHDYIAEANEGNPARAKEIAESEYTRSFLADMERHIDQVAKPDGLFHDTHVTGHTWRAQVRRVRCVFYRAFAEDERANAPDLIERAATTLVEALQQSGVKVRRCNGADLYAWLLSMFNPNPGWARSDDLPEVMPLKPKHPPEGCAPLMTEFAEMLNLSQPRSDQEAGIWEFDGRCAKTLVLQNLTAQPLPGHFTAERKRVKHHHALFDLLPPGALLSFTVVIKPQHLVRAHVERIRSKSRARNADAYATRAETEAVLKRMSTGDKLYPTLMTMTVTGQSRKELDNAIAAMTALLNPGGVKFIEPKNDLAPLDAFVRSLPMAFDIGFDTREFRRSRFIFCSQIAAMLPFYDRARGTGRPGFCFFNRGGAPLLFDPLSRHDRKKNAHMVTLGTTGSGKSATLVGRVREVMAIYRPRVVIADAGESFRLQVEDFAMRGLSTHTVMLTTKGEVSLPPFVNAHRLLEDKAIMATFAAIQKLEVSEDDSEPLPKAAQRLLSDPLAVTHEELRERVIRHLDELDAGTGALASPDAPDQEASGDSSDDDDFDQQRDIHGEMMVSAMLMITGGEQREVNRMTRADRHLISTALIRSAVASREAGTPHPLVQDVAMALMAMRNDPAMSQTRGERAEEMGQAMLEFTKGLRGKMFNRFGEDWPEVDVTLVEMKDLAKSDNSDALALAYGLIFDSVQSRGERYQFEGRPLIFLTDEAHMITRNELLGPKIATGTKMWRKLNIWFWLATQNMADFPDSMSRVLSMCEWWMLLNMPPDEVRDVARFRTLTPEQLDMVLSASKETPKYTEGVMLSTVDQWLFRNVPPALSIALAMTEGHEKAERKRLMDAHQCSELQAAYMVAKRLEKARS